MFKHSLRLVIVGGLTAVAVALAGFAGGARAETWKIQF